MYARQKSIKHLFLPLPSLMMNVCVKKKIDSADNNAVVHFGLAEFQEKFAKCYI